MKKKSFACSVKIKDAVKGEVSAVFSTFDVIDKDGDVTPASAMQDGAEFVVSAYGHKSWEGVLPVGKGSIRTTKSEAIADMEFFMDTTQGRDTFNAVAALQKSGLGEWSYGFDILDAAPGVFDGKDVRMLNAVKVHEVSPVLVGAGVNTRTLSVKSAGTKSDAGRVAYMNSIRPHTTATDNGDWNPSAVKASIPGDASVLDLRNVYAWCSPDGDPEMKSSYKYPHHDEQGNANIRACIVGIAQLNGAGGKSAGIPDADRRGVYNHLVGHLEDAGREAPELREDMSPSSLKFSDECAGVLASVSSLTERAQEIMSMRAKKGRPLGAGAVEYLEWLDSEMKKLRAIIDTPQVDMAREYIRFVGFTNGIGNENA